MAVVAFPNNQKTGEAEETLLANHSRHAAQLASV